MLQNLKGRSPGPDRRPHGQSQLTQSVGRPPPRLASGRLTDHRPAAKAQQWSSAFSQHRRPTETASHDHVECASESGRPGQQLGPFLLDRHPVLQAQLANSRPQERCPAGGGVNQDPLGLGEPQSQRQPGQAGAAAQIRSPAQAPASTGTGGSYQCLGETGGVVEMRLDRAGTQETQAPALFQHREEDVPVLAQQRVSRRRAE